MKLKYLFAIALSSLAIFAGCTKEEANNALKNLQVSKSFVAIAPSGSSETVSITSSVAWNIVKPEDIPDWLSVSATSGAANSETKVTFSAPSCDFGRQAELQIKAGVHTQFITVRQGEMTVETVSCKEAMSGVEGKTYRVKGAVTAIANDQYGNLYINDGSGKECYIYGTLDANGAEKNFGSLGIELGDVITVEGPLQIYGGSTYELVNVTVVKIEKSLLKIVEEYDKTTSAGGQYIITAAFKGNGVFFNKKVDWLSLDNLEYKKGVPTKMEKSPADTAILTFALDPNSGAARRGVVTLSSSNSSTATSIDVTIEQPGQTGTEALPYTVAEAIEFCNTLSSATTSDYYVSGVISKIQYEFSAGYGTATFWMSDTGEYYGDPTKDFEAYSVYWFGNTPWKDGDEQIELGANVVVCGQLTLYKGTAETNSKKAWIYKINGQKNNVNGLGLSDCPLNIAGAVAYCNTLESNQVTPGKVWVEGTVCELTKYQYGADYNTASFWLSDDGKADGAKFEAYSIYYLNNPDCDASVKFPEDGKIIALGQEIVLYGNLTNYKGTAETASKKAYIFSQK